MKWCLARIRLCVVLMLSLCVLSACVGNGASEGATVAFSFDRETGRVLVTIDSPKGISAAQVKLDVPEEVAIGDVKLSGFMVGADHKNKGREHRWYDLSANGEIQGQIAIQLSAPNDSTSIIAIFDVDLKDQQGNKVPVRTELPLWVEVRSDEQEITTPSELEPGQSRIAFGSDRDGNDEIYVIDADGSNLKRITNNPEDDYNPTWSPDGTRIAFVRHSTFDNIYVMDVDGSNLTQLTNNQANDLDPTWSPDGTRIAFTSGRDGNYEIYVMNTDGTNQRNLSMNPSADQDPTWSPDGTSIAFSSNRDGGGFEDIEIYVMDSDGTNQTRLTNNSWHDYDPDWSPDGTRIAFASGRDGTDSVYVMNSDGSNQTRLTYYGRSPTWSPDCTKIAFTSFSNESPKIHVINADGTSERRLTFNDAVDFVPSWSPMPSTPKASSDSPKSMCIPSLISPGEGAILDNGRADRADDIMWDFDWSDCQGATEYHLYVIHSGSEFPVIDNDRIAHSHYSDISSGSYIIEGNRYGWKWKVRAKMDGQWGEWSEVGSFDIEPCDTDPPKQ